jgi:hypothetical protein
MELFRRVTEGLARKTTRRGFFGHGAEVALGALAGAAAGTLARGGGAIAGGGTACAFPGPPCPCEGCQAGGVCAKPCIVMTFWYSAGCWVTSTPGGPVTCCDCDCIGRIPNAPAIEVCGCGTDWHNDPTNCPNGPG